MEITTFITLLFIGLFAGIASGYVGIGGGIIIIPSLIYFLGLGQHQAQGVSLALMLPPIGVLAFYKYFQSGSFNLEIEGQIIENKLLIYQSISNSTTNSLFSSTEAEKLIKFEFEVRPSLPI